MNLESGLMMKNKKGFTLIELLAVIVILGILLSISITAVNKIRRKQNIENKLNIVSNIMTGAKSYIADHPEFWNSAEEGDYKTGSINPRYMTSPTDNRTGRWLKLNDIIKYAEFDTETYPYLYYENGKNETNGIRSLYVRNCEKNSLKYEIIYTYREEGKTDYNAENNLSDCGCEEQAIKDHSFKFCSDSTPDAGWDINGKYYDKNGNEDSSKDINFEK